MVRRPVGAERVRGVVGVPGHRRGLDSSRLRLGAIAGGGSRVPVVGHAAACGGVGGGAAGTIRSGCCGRHISSIGTARAGAPGNAPPGPERGGAAAVTARIVRLRMATVAGFVAMVFAVLTGRAVQLSVYQGKSLRRLAIRQQTTNVVLPGNRGEIVDRYGEPLALTREAAAVYLRPAELSATSDDLASVARILGISRRVVEAKAKSQKPFVWLDRQASIDQWSELAELQLLGIGSQPSRSREYPHGSLAGQLLGFIGIDGQGLEGIERGLDARLRGEEEALDVVRDARGRWVAVDGRWRPLPRVGARVTLTIDARLQEVAERELVRAVEEFRAVAATAVVLDPKTGEVLAMANVPQFDPNAFRRASPSDWRNRAITDAYEPGSTFKAILASVALEEGVVRPGEPVWCENGRYAVGRQTIHDHDPYEVLSFSEVIQHSSNIGSAKIGERLGPERFAHAIEAFGFGRQTGIDLSGEATGLVRPVASWKPIDLATASFGQGLAVTPLQLARAFAAIANGGRLVRPYIVREVADESGRPLLVGQPHTERRVLSPATAAQVREILTTVVEGGTGQAARINGFRVAGKTGTAQKVDPKTRAYSRSDYMSSFVGFVPADDPALVILVVVDRPRTNHYGGVVAAPVFRRIAIEGLHRLGIRPGKDSGKGLGEDRPGGLGDRPIAPRWSLPRDGLQSVALSLREDPLARDRIPSFLGMSMRDALVVAQRSGIAVAIQGSGYVTQQHPPSGVPRTDVTLRLKFGPAVY